MIETNKTKEQESEKERALTPEEKWEQATLANNFYFLQSNETSSGCL